MSRSAPQARRPCALALGFLGAALATSPALRAQELELVPITTALDAPTGIAHAGDDRLFVTERDGLIRIVADGELRAEPFLDIRDRVRAGGEQGLLSVAFHPRYAETGFLFVNYTRRGDGATVISRFSRSASSSERADLASEAVLLVIAQPFANHNGGQLQFGPDGMLWAGMGDGGSANDPQCHAQRRGSLLGKLLRLDVDRGAGAPPFHAVPADNPFVGAGTFPELAWAVGLRNPWRFSFDRLTGDLFVGDVGQGEREEIDFERAGDSGGRNFGWKVMEGSACTGSLTGCVGPVPGCRSPAFTAPILEYRHERGNCSVTGGVVYRGAAIPALVGAYLYGDFCSGRIWQATESGGTWTATELAIRAPLLSSFGEDHLGEVYVLTLDGSLLRLVGPPLPPPCDPDSEILCLADGRFRVRVTWDDGRGSAGTGSTVPLTGDTGAFWFFSPDNLELVVKVLDACEAFGRFWVFAAGLTDVAVRLEIVDSVTGQRREYRNASGNPFPPITDTNAFATCPSTP